ncbi:hypothetical protein VEE68_10630 [Escherichia coli]|nr:hypothetical protein VEE68_10630 [Escherichia coli]
MAEKKQWHETLHDQFGQYFAVDNVLYHEKTDHQDLIIFENAAFGRVMALDGVVQTTERDEFIYHEHDDPCSATGPWSRETCADYRRRRRCHAA